MTEEQFSNFKLRRRRVELFFSACLAGLLAIAMGCGGSGTARTSSNASNTTGSFTTGGSTTGGSTTGGSTTGGSTTGTNTTGTSSGNTDGNSGGNSGAPPSTTPNSTTKGYVASLIEAVGQSVPATQFRAFGPSLGKHGVPVFNPVLGLYFVLRTAPDGIVGRYYTTSSLATQAGSLSYSQSESTGVLSGTMEITSGPYKGLSGEYNEVTLLTNGMVSGFNGTISYTVGPANTIDNTFSVTLGSNASFTGTASVAVVLNNRYTHTEKLVYNIDGSFNMATEDINNLKGTLKFHSDISGTGTIAGHLAGLPATFSWSANGNGTVTYADKSTATVTAWHP